MEIGEGLGPAACGPEPVEQPEATTTLSRQTKSASAGLTCSNYQV